MVGIIAEVARRPDASISFSLRNQATYVLEDKYAFATLERTKIRT